MNNGRARPPRATELTFGEALLGVEGGAAAAALDDGLALLADAPVQLRPDLRVLQLRRPLRLLRRHPGPPPPSERSRSHEKKPLET